ncbi:MAG: hypothetical protein RLZZ546_1938 [Bacteroidota bacterium]|jgi:hypothetical protein
MSKKLFVVVAILCMFFKLQAQRKYFTNTSTWFAYIGTHHIGGKWSLFADAQLRRSDLFNQQMQILLRPGLLYHITENTNLGLGYAYVITDVYGNLPAKAPFGENRFWQQFQYRASVGKFEVTNRLRLEQRWVHVPVQKADLTWAAGDAVYTNRLRAMYKFSLPFKGNKIVDKSFYIYAGDEIFVNFGKNIKLNIFEQNRAQIGLGYRIPKLGRFEAGYSHQFIIRANGVDIEENHIIQMNLLANFDLKKRESSH